MRKKTKRTQEAASRRLQRMVRATSSALKKARQEVSKMTHSERAELLEKGLAMIHLGWSQMESDKKTPWRSDQEYWDYVNDCMNGHGAIWRKK